MKKMGPKGYKMRELDRFGPVLGAKRRVLGGERHLMGAERPPLGAKRPSMGDNEHAGPDGQGRKTMADSNAKKSEERSAQTAHRILMNPVTFQAMSLAMYNLSIANLQSYSPRRMLTDVLTDAHGPLFRLNISELAGICQPEHLFGSVRVNIRLDSAVNNRLREFRDHSEQKLGRPVSVLEAISACIYVINRSQ